MQVMKKGVYSFVNGWALHRINQDPIFVNKLIFTDESTFIRNGQTGRHWTYHWSEEDHHESIEFHAQNINHLSIEENIQNILPETLENVKNSWVQKLQLCVTNNGGNFEHL